MKKKKNDGTKAIEKQLANDGGARTLLDRAKAYAVMKKGIEGRVLTGNVMEELRSAFGISQSAVSRDIGVSITAYRQWESGQSIPSEKKYKMLQDYFCVYNEDDIKAVLSEVDKIALTSEEAGSLEDLMNDILKEESDG